MKTKTITTVLSLGLLVGLTAPACGSSGDESTGDGDSGDGDSGDGDSGDGDVGDGDVGDGDTGDGDSGDGDTGDGDAGDGDGDSGDGDAMGGMSGDGDEPEYPDTEFTYDPSQDAEPETCAATQIEAEEIFLDMFVILDRSGSMTIGAPDDSDDGVTGSNNSDGYCDIGDPNVGSRWCNAINALYGFFSDPSTVGTGVSYAEFSNTGCGPFDMAVDFGILETDDSNGQLESIEDALNDDDPDGSTNTEGAIDTLIAETSAHMPVGTRKTISVLITDGDPNGCEEDRDDLNAMLVDHYTATGIPTFVIGMDGVSSNNLEELAQNAGAAPHTNYCVSGDAECSYYSVGDGNPTVFMDALADIRSSVLGCEYAVPQADVGLSNLDTLEVKFTPNEGASEIILEQMASEGACSSDDQYWVDLSGGGDPIIKLCPATCDTRGDGAAIDISLKCEGS